MKRFAKLLSSVALLALAYAPSVDLSRWGTSLDLCNPDEIRQCDRRCGQMGCTGVCVGTTCQCTC